MTAEVVMLTVWIVWLVLWWAAAFWSDRAVKAPPRRYQLLYRVLPALGGGLLFGARSEELRLWHTPDVIAWVMVAVALAGFTFTWWARIHLGRLWSSSVSRKAEHHIVDTGPYRIVRHPIYTGIILASAGLAGIGATALGIAGFLLSSAGFWIKARLEERFLSEELGADAYAAYKARTPMLIPFLPTDAN